MKLSHSANIESLMTGHQHAKRGGISKPHLNVTGPRKPVDAHHLDGRPLHISLQVSWTSTPL
jgi:hypothetical protein